MKNKLAAWAIALATCTPLLACAQAANTEPPKQSPQLSYRSAFADYTPWQGARPGNWKALNDAVGKSSGHATAMAIGAASEPAPAASKRAMADHSGHQTHTPGGKT